MATDSEKRPPGPEMLCPAALPYIVVVPAAVTVELDLEVPKGEVAWVAVDAWRVDAPEARPVVKPTAAAD